METAEALGIDTRTLATSLKQTRLSRRVRKALELELATNSGQEEAVARLEERVVLLEGELAGLRTAMVAGFQALRDAQRQRVAQPERQLPRSGAGAEGKSQVEAADLGLDPVVGGPPVHGEPRQGHDSAEPKAPLAPARKTRRQYPDLVTSDAQPDDEQVYGAAWPLVDEWRRLWGEHKRPGKGLAWLKREVRILELEVAMLREHHLTLPPATYPQRGLELHTHLGWRLRALSNRRRSRAWATVRLWIRRTVVFGLLLAAAFSVMLLSASQGSPS
ncbi:MAG: hypothetical protein F4052_07500 [Dehalococcoidia bacterium]|nr:hypothetical protein [Dehalococcoidia bacterium]MYK26778.1 hypothetical protein [Dehalococcoidia bacterium]